MDYKYAEHKQLNLPPFSATAKFIVSDLNKANAFAVCKNLHTDLQNQISQQNLNETINAQWAPAFFPRLHNKYWFYVFVNAHSTSQLNTFLQSVTWPETVKVDISPASLI